VVGYYDTPGYAYGVRVEDGLIYVADGGGGVRIYEFYGEKVEEGDEDIREELWMQVRGGLRRIEVEFGVPRGKYAIAEVYDVAGRRLWSERFREGRHRVMQKRGAGVYVFRLKLSDGEVRTKKVVVVR